MTARPLTDPWFRSGTLLAFLAVALGAFGAHALRDSLPADRLAIFETAVRYQMYHALALLAVGLAGSRLTPAAARRSGLGFLLGIIIFSSTLLVIALTGIRWPGALTPIGGLLLLAAWLNLFVAGLRRPAE